MLFYAAQLTCMKNIRMLQPLLVPNRAGGWPACRAAGEYAVLQERHAHHTPQLGRYVWCRRGPFRVGHW